MSAVDLQFSLHDAYTRDAGPIYMSGIQALVRLPIMQRQRDKNAGLNTAGLVSGYRGSPLGAYDQQLWRASKWLAEHDVVFQPGLNEDLAATALWGAQMQTAFGPSRVDGVFGVWYGKGPGVDRTGDVFRNANMLGTSALGGVLAVAGDDHAAQSSMFPHQTDGVFQSVSMPVLQPASLAEILSLGLAGFALSRFSGLWVGMKTIAEVVESAGTFTLPPAYRAFERPSDIEIPEHGFNWDPRLAWPEQRAELERRLIEQRLPAARAWARANALDHVVAGAGGPMGIVTVGKAHQDLMQALADLDIGESDLRRLGMAIYKVAMSWPLETSGIKSFARDRQEILVLEEKRGVVEGQIKEALFHIPSDSRPRVVGKRDERGAPLLPEISEFDPLMVARILVLRLKTLALGAELQTRLEALVDRQSPTTTTAFPSRKPYFCSGCPHNTSTNTPEGSISGGGIGCHVMALSLPDRKTSTFSQMGGEGAQWIGAAPFSKTGHIFQNLGDGTYQHSGLLAIRAAIAAKANITYKILYNDAVAMTGGQAAEGVIDPARITRQLAAEGVNRVVLVSETPHLWEGDPLLAPGVRVAHRDGLDAIQRELRNIAGVTAIVYEQTCAAEKRRRRKKDTALEPATRLFINDRVCEGCGDCSIQSNCIAVEPLETDFGRKRKINQSACNKDLSCVKGFCPSFVELDGPLLRKPDADRLVGWEAEHFKTLVAPKPLELVDRYDVVVAGIGGNGVLTIGALLGVAAHLDGKAASVLDFTGLAQKNGAVVSQVRLAASNDLIQAVRIGPASVDLLLATDRVVAAQADVLARLSSSRSRVILNTDDAPTADVVRQRDMVLPSAHIDAALSARVMVNGLLPAPMTRLAAGLFGDTVAANVMMLGVAYQQGLLPLSLDALVRAIELNGTAVPANKRAFSWGRLLVTAPEIVHEAASLKAPADEPSSLERMIKRQVQDLTRYQDSAYARRFIDLVEIARAAGRRAGDLEERFVSAVAQTAYRLMAYKDEYEVARLYVEPAFKTALANQFAGHRKMSVWLSPPLLSRTDPATGRPKKRKFGPWVFFVFSILARLKGLRGSMLDPFGWTEERRTERRLVAEFSALAKDLSARLTSDRLEASVAAARALGDIRGFGPVKAAALAAAEKDLLALKADLNIRRATDPMAA